VSRWVRNMHACSSDPAKRYAGDTFSDHSPAGHSRYLERFIAVSLLLSACSPSLRRLVGGRSLVVGRWWSETSGQPDTLHPSASCSVHAHRVACTPRMLAARRSHHLRDGESIRYRVRGPARGRLPSVVGPNNFRLIASPSCFDMNRNAGRWIL